MSTPCADGGGHRLLDEAHLPHPRRGDGVHHGPLLHLGDAAGHADHHPGHKHPAAADLLQVVADEQLRHGEVGDDPVVQRPGHGDPLRGAAQHIVGLGAHGDHLVGHVVHRQDGGLAEDDALPIQIDLEPGSPQIDGNISSDHSVTLPYWGLNPHFLILGLLYHSRPPFSTGEMVRLPFQPHCAILRENFSKE